MSVEIFILSGARAGEQIVLDTTEFRVGSEPNCEIRFNPQQDVPAKGRSAVFRLMDDGWYVSCTGMGELLVNQEVVSGRMRIRSGDVLRMSAEGPDLSFSIVSRAQTPDTRTSPPAVMRPEAPASASPAPAPRTITPDPTPTAAPTPARAPAPAPTPILSPTAQVSVPQTAEPVGPSTGKMRPILWASSIGGGLAMIVLLVCVVVYTARPSPVAPAPPQEVLNSGKSDVHAADPNKMATIKEVERIRAAQKAKLAKAHQQLERKNNEPTKNEP